MELFFVYLIKSSLILLAGTAIFMSLLRHETFHRLNRCLLLGVIFMSLILPFVNIGYDSPLSRLSQIIETAVKGSDGNTLSVYNATFGNGLNDELSVTPRTLFVDDDIQSENAFSVVTTREWISIIYFAIVALLIFRLLYMYASVVHILRKGETVYYKFVAGGKDIALRVHDADYAPFSWFGYICMPRSELNDAANDIIVHEMAHVKKLHSYDILLVDMLIVMQWFNPMAWVMKMLLKDIHEYEADEAVVASGIDAKKYQLLIIKKAVGARLYSIANSFNHSLTIKRITMMCKKKSNSWHSAKVLYVVPLAIVAVCAFSSSKNIDETDSKVSEKTEYYNDIRENIPIDNVLSVSEQLSVTDTVVNVKDTNDGTDVYQVVDEMPEFPGGMSELMKYLRHNMKYPEEAMQKGVQGRSLVGFVVGKDGSVYNIEVVKSAGSELLDAEAVRVVSAMPKWNPGKQRGEAVNVRFTLPLHFAIQGLKKNSESTETQNANMSEVTVYTYSGNNDKSSETVYQVVDEMPEFPGGTAALMKYMSENMKYPEEAQQKGIQGRSIVGFVVEADGTINNVKIVRSSGSELLDAEAVRVVSAMPKWIPGKQNGKAVGVQFSLPANFRLQNAKSNNVPATQK